MIAALKKLFEPTEQVEEQSISPELASACLLIEVARADNCISDDEKHAVWHLIQGLYGLSEQDAQALLDQAIQAAEDAVSVHTFTRVVKDSFSTEQKIALVHGLWLVAYQDQQLDPYEEAMIRKVADLLYLRHSEFIQAKHAAQEGSS